MPDRFRGAGNKHVPASFMQRAIAGEVILPVILQREVAARVRQKYAAKLKFLADESFDEGTHIDKLLRDPKVSRDLEADAD
jgi:ribosome-binding factor A